mgnify:CR=1 FL=1
MKYEENSLNATPDEPANINFCDLHSDLNPNPLRELYKEQLDSMSDIELKAVYFEDLIESNPLTSFFDPKKPYALMSQNVRDKVESFINWCLTNGEMKSARLTVKMILEWIKWTKGNVPFAFYANQWCRNRQDKNGKLATKEMIKAFVEHPEGEEASYLMGCGALKLIDTNFNYIRPIIHKGMPGRTTFDLNSMISPEQGFTLGNARYETINGLHFEISQAGGECNTIVANEGYVDECGCEILISFELTEELNLNDLEMKEFKTVPWFKYKVTLNKFERTKNLFKYEFRVLMINDIPMQDVAIVSNVRYDCCEYYSV